MILRRSASSVSWQSLGCCLGLALYLVGCAPSTEEDSAEVSGNVEIFNWWARGGEREALEIVLELHQSHYPRATVTNATVEIADRAREVLRQRVLEGLPPDTFQANAGADLLNNWVRTNAKDAAESRVESLEDIARESGWIEAFDPDVLGAASLDENLWALPVNVHRINSLVIRKDLFEKHGLAAPRRIEELYALCERIKHDAAIQAEAPYDEGMACLGLGNKYDWPLSQMTFEMILPARASAAGVSGASYYEQFWTGKLSGDATNAVEAMEVALYLYCGGLDTSDCLSTGYFNPDVNDIDWDAGVLKVAEKRAMMAAMGDWAKGLLESKGQKPGKHFDIVPFPGSEETFVFTSDTLALPKGALNRTGAVALLHTFASVEAQVAFNQLKGSIPARRVDELDMGDFDPVALATLSDFQEAEKVLALSGLLASDVMPDLARELKTSLRRGSIEIIRSYVAANYDSIPPR